jgi:hypothetical protein
VNTKSFSSTRADGHGKIALCCACVTGLLSMYQQLSADFTLIRSDVLGLGLKKVKPTPQIFNKLLRLSPAETIPSPVRREALARREPPTASPEPG